MAPTWKVAGTKMPELSRGVSQELFRTSLTAASKSILLSNSTRTWLCRRLIQERRWERHLQMIDETIIAEVKSIHDANMKIWEGILESREFSNAANHPSTFAHDMGDLKLSSLNMDAQFFDDRDTENALHDIVKTEFPILVKLCVLGVELGQIHDGLAAKANQAIKRRIGWLTYRHDRSYIQIIEECMTDADRSTLTYNNLSYLRGWGINE